MQLRKHGIQKLIVAGLIAHTCVEATIRYAAELGYEVAMVKDATASYSEEQCEQAATADNFLENRAEQEDQHGAVPVRRQPDRLAG